MWRDVTVAAAVAPPTSSSVIQQEAAVHRVPRETLRIFPPRIGRTEHVLASPHVHKRAADLASFPRVGRGTSNLQLFPRVGRAPSLAAFPRVGRKDGSLEPEYSAGWCTDCPELDLLRQLARRAVLLPPRIGRAGEKTFSYMIPRPRIGKRLRSPTVPASGNKRQMQGGLAVFPRVGRGGATTVEQIEDEEDPKWFADPVKRQEGTDRNNLWFGPRLGRRRRDLQDQMAAAESLFPVYHFVEAPLVDFTEHDDQGSTSQESSGSSSWSSAAAL
ncbi:hypothetical protein B566_EDAN006456 [Ephemera danica]|nr:hypothetical protein B566_EDAN006456 [Ephemera danica]